MNTLRTKYLDTPVHTFYSGLHALTRGYDVVLMCNSANAMFLPLFKLGSRAVAINVDGLEWKRKKWNWLGRSVYRLSERLSYSFSDALVTDAKAIQDYYRSTHGHDGVFIPYGASVDKTETTEALAQLGVQPRSYLVYASRFEPENNAHLIIEAYRYGRAYRVRGKYCVMAGYNAMIPYICPELPVGQREALAFAVKAPIVYTSVLLEDWRARKKLGIGFFASPGTYYAVSMLDFPVSMGGYKFSPNPDSPIIVHMERFAIGDDPTATRREQRLAGRRELFATSFETLERETRKQLAGALAGGGFDPAEDIAGITVNRWGHGYSCRYRAGFDSGYEGNESPHIVGRQRLGRITIANCDAGASASNQSSHRSGASRN